jgi:putative transposase
VCERDRRSRQRRRNYADQDTDVWEISEYRGRYGGVLGVSTVQQIERKNCEAWRSFFALRENREANGKPGYWGNEDDGRDLRTYIRNTSYSIQWGEYSRLALLKSLKIYMFVV